MAPYTITRLLRKPVLLVFTILFSGIFSYFLCYQSDYLSRQRRELNHVNESYEIECVVSSIDGSRTTGLRMTQSYLGFVTDPVYEFTQFVKDLRLTKEFGLKLTNLTEQHITGTRLMGVNAPECADVLDESLGRSVIYLTDDFYTSEKPQCIVSEELYRLIVQEESNTQENSGMQEEITVGHVLNAEITDPVYGVNETLAQAIEIVGVYRGAGAEVYIPWGYAERLMLDISEQLSCDSIRFHAADNTQIAELAERAGEKFIAVDILGSETIYSYALTIYDEQYRSTVSAIEQNIYQAELLMPCALALCVALGILVGFLDTRHETRDYALMRIVGVTPLQLFVSIMLSRMIPAMVGCFVSAALTHRLTPSLIYLVCFLIGGCAAAVRPIKVRPTEMLKDQE